MIAQVVFHSLWQSLAIAAAVWGMLRLAKGWSAESRYWVWVLALVAIAVLPLLVFVPRPQFDVEPLTVPGFLPSEPVSSQPIETPAAAPSVNAVEKASDFIPLAWLAIVAWRLLRLAFAANTLRRWRLNAHLIFAERGYEVLESADVTTPLAMGIWRPCILLPRGLASRLERQQLRSILLHELAHIQRGDVRLGFVQRLIEAVYFYNPVVHWVARQIEREREASCDDRAIRATGTAAPDYAECLVDVSRHLVTGRAASASLLAVGAFRSASELRHRVRRLLDRPELEDTRVSLRSIGVAGCAIFSALVTLALMTPNARAQVVKSSDVNAVFIGDGTRLIMAARAGDLLEVKRLLADGADVNLPSPGDGNPLIMAAAHGHLHVATTLVAHGARVNELVPEDETPLINAARHGHLNLVSYLIDRGADVNLAVLANGRELRSPLSEARKHGRSEVVQFLLNRGAQR
jgi:bla regulator protein BlaR1